MPDIGWYGLVLVIAAGATAALTVPAKRIAIKVGYVSHPGPRSVHDRPIAYGGGAAMLMGFLVAVLSAAAIPALRSVFTDSPEMMGVVLAAGAMFAVGLIDDVRDMSAPAKMAGQVLAASILYFSGVTMYELKIPLAGFFVLTPGIIPLITAIWVICLTNAVNLIDGLDGLAAGVVAIGGGALALYGIRLMGLGLLPSDNIGALVAVIACGICLGFLPFNFNPARIFMGDAGAHFLGLLMAASTMVIGGRVPTAVPISGVTYFFFAPLFIPILILGVPLVDMAFAFVRRTARGPASTPPTKSTSTTACCDSGTGRAAASSSCGRGRRSSRASCCSRSSCTRSTPSSRSARRPSASASTRSFTLGCAVALATRRTSAPTRAFRASPRAPNPSLRW